MTASDSTVVTTATVFDPFETIFVYPVDNDALAFINTYFDLVEIQRLKMEDEIGSTSRTREEWGVFYEKHKKEVEIISKKYFNEVDLGKNRDAMQPWNEIVKTQLSIDNQAIFPPTED